MEILFKRVSLIVVARLDKHDIIFSGGFKHGKNKVPNFI